MLIGAPIGLLVGLLGSRWVASWLFGVTPADPAIHAAACGALLVVVVLASVFPAWRAARTNPVDVLRLD